MATLISSADFLALLDEVTAIWEKQLSIYGSVDDVASPVAGTIQNLGDNIQSIVTSSLDNIQQVIDLGQVTKDNFGSMNAESAALVLKPLLSALNTHIATQGPITAAAITGIDTYLQYLNSSPFSAMAAPGYLDLHHALFASNLDSQGVMSPAIHPTWNSAVSANGIGKRAVGGAYTAGTTPNIVDYSETVPLLEVTTDFANGATHPVVTVSGHDHLDATTTWSVTFGDNNPVAAVSTTFTDPIVAQARQTIAVASATGIIHGSVLTVNAGLTDQEVIVVENVSGSDITAVFQKAHADNATVTGHTTVALTPAGGARIRTITGIVITIGTHDAGEVRVVGRQDRVPV